ncbi:Protein PNS1 [Carex littledalei]|uniref:Choline transporter-like protein n=1 Tax=Carex littledalei TaxID=544730 RepID=A0A833QAV6_9POAL|nr:Protein PNS1 [Carex littledalei]
MENRRISNGARSNQVTPTHVVFQVPTPTASPIPPNFTMTPPPATSFMANAAKFLFFIHLLIFTILVIFLSVHGSVHRTHAFHPADWYLPILASIATSYLASIFFLSFSIRRPSLSIKTSIRLSPLLTCGVAVLLLSGGTGSSLGFAIIFLAIAVTQALYACWITPRLPYAYEILSIAVANTKVPVGTLSYISLSLLVGSIYAILWIIGVGGVVEDKESQFGPLYMIALLLSLSWTMHVIKYVVHVAIASLAHAQLILGDNGSVGPAFRQAMTWAFGDVCLGAAVAPVVGATRGAARAMDVLAGGSDEFLFSCTSCFSGVADQMVGRGNRWGLVHVAAYGKSFGTASRDVWEMFIKQGMGRLLDNDLTGPICFLWGTTGGSVAALTAGPWVLLVNKEYFIAATIYSFLIGYFMTRVAMAWPQACVAAFHVVFAEDPLNQQLGSCIHERLRELGREDQTHTNI